MSEGCATKYAALAVGERLCGDKHIDFVLQVVSVLAQECG